MKKLFIILISLLILCGCTTSNPSSDDTVQDNLKWWQKTLVYEAYPSSFKDTNDDGYGDLKGLTSKLDYLQSIGIGAIWITPVFDSPMGDNGYDVADYYNINPIYGTMDDMDELILEANKRNIKIVMDLVFNHTSNENKWFIESSKSKDNDKSDWYIWKDPKEDGSAPNNWRGIFGGSAWTYCKERDQYYLHTFADFQPDLNWENENVRKALFDIANFWIDKGVGGFRVDAVTYIKKPNDFSDGPIDGNDGMSRIHDITANTPGILDFLRQFKKEVSDTTDIFVVGEANGVPNEQLSDWVGNDGVFDMIFSFNLMDIRFNPGANWYDTKDFTLREFKDIVSSQQYLSNSDIWIPNYLENHDQPRSVEHFLLNCSDYTNGAKALAMMLLTLRGTPFIYQGEEIGMSNVNRSSIDEYNDISSSNQYKMAIENGKTKQEALQAVWQFSRDNARSPMQWNTDKNAGFSNAVPWLSVNDNYININVEAQENNPDSILNFYRSLNQIRINNDVLISGKYEEILNDDESIFAYYRENDNNKALILINFTDKRVEYDKKLTENAKLLLSSYDETSSGILKPYEAVCYLIK